MAARLRQAVGVGAAVLFIALAAPAAAFANGGGKCNASACKVYVEPNVPNAGGQQQPQSQHGVGPTSSSEKQTQPNVSRVLANAGPNKAALSRLLRGSGSGSLNGADGVAAPSALWAAFDLGAGPTALLAILVATAVAVGLYGARGWRQRRGSNA